MVRTVMEIILMRDGGCVGMGQLPGDCGGELAPHHIINRGMGGQGKKSKVYDGPDWRLTMCEVHNGLMESDAYTAERARALGFKLSRNGKKPEYARVHYRDGWHRLVGEFRLKDVTL